MKNQKCGEQCNKRGNKSRRSRNVLRRNSICGLDQSHAKKHKGAKARAKRIEIAFEHVVEKHSDNSGNDRSAKYVLLDRQVGRLAEELNIQPNDSERQRSHNLLAARGKYRYIRQAGEQSQQKKSAHYNCAQTQKRNRANRRITTAHHFIQPESEKHEEESKTKNARLDPDLQVAVVSELRLRRQPGSTRLKLVRTDSRSHRVLLDQLQGAFPKKNPKARGLFDFVCRRRRGWCCSRRLSCLSNQHIGRLRLSSHRRVARPRNRMNPFAK